MEDERLLAEALRAHAAGGVSTPSGAVRPDDDRGGDDGGATHPAEGSSRVRGRFRPLGRGRRAAGSDPAPTVAAPAAPAGGVRPGPRASAPGAPAAPPRPTPPLAGAPHAPRPAGGGPGAAGPAAASAPPRPDPVGWPSTRVAWWSAVAVLGGGVLGAVLAVISLAAPG